MDLNFTPEQQLRQMEIQAGVKKIVYGTMIGALAASFFPFAQKFSTEVSTYLSSDRIARDSALASRRSFLEELSAEGRSPNLDVRIILAEYYAHLANETDRKQWALLLTRLEAQRAALREAEQNRTAVVADPNSTEAEIAKADSAAQQLRESADPERRSGNFNFDDVDPLLNRLLSDFRDDRVQARTALAAIGLPIVKPALARLADEKIDFRTRLGLLVALTGFMRDNKHMRAEILEELTQQDLITLLEAAVYQERAIRIHAAEFLFDLADPRIFQLVTSVWDAHPDANGRYNLALIISGAAPFVEGGQKATVRDILADFVGQVGPKTDALLGDAITMLNR